MTIDDTIRYPSIESAIRANQIAEEDGSIRDRNVLGSVLAASRHAASYEDADLINQTAILIQRIALTNPFIDGNKRTAFILGNTFLMMNGYQLNYCDEQDEMALASILAETLESMVADKSFDLLVNWIESHIVPFDDKERQRETSEEPIMQLVVKKHPKIIQYLGFA